MTNQFLLISVSFAITLLVLAGLLIVCRKFHSISNGMDAHYPKRHQCAKVVAYNH